MDKIPAVGKTKLQLQQCMTTTGDVGSERWAARYLQLSRNLGTYFFDNYGRKFMAAAHAYPEIFTILGIVTQAVTENVKEVMIPEYCVGQRTLDEWNEGCPIRSPGTPVANHIIKQVTKVIEECSNLEHERYEFFNYWDDWKIPNLQEYYKNGTLALIEEMMVHSPWCSEDTVHIKTDIARVVEIEPYKVRNKSIKRTIDGEYKNNTITKQLFNSTGRRTENTGNTDWTCDETIESYEEDELCQEETYRGKLWWWWRRKENKDWDDSSSDEDEDDDTDFEEISWNEENNGEGTGWLLGGHSREVEDWEKRLEQRIENARGTGRREVLRDLGIRQNKI